MTDQRDWIVYKTTCTATGMFYIGKTFRKKYEKYYYGGGLVLKRSIQKHGASQHKREVLSHHTSENEAYAEEERQIRIHLSTFPELCMNIALGGKGAMSGRSHSDETKKKIGEANFGRRHTLSQETRRKMSEAKTGEKSFLWQEDESSYQR